VQIESRSSPGIDRSRLGNKISRELTSLHASEKFMSRVNTTFTCATSAAELVGTEVMVVVGF